MIKQKFQISGISCGGCISRVKKTLEEHPNIEKVEIFLAPKGATIISMNETLSVQDIQKQLDKLGEYTITKINQ
ncbi:heavy-metal-associated domain-containing protein [Tenacibaculum sp. Mcav3-52]|uniref:heavy-metal-associated domain-containing protein n=1 Tax=unclassified Tenacibaculum TaxID=2635139 RepID=UPI00135CDAC7|nr:heavy metal-associated domain-containing protein [Tenacibaculum sp. Mcav3-52]MCG7501211.1 heavy-metal-associated domain-containing protein [Tenacibaculum sp. Mcav3-52]